jgi:hypothetical protein
MRKVRTVIYLEKKESESLRVSDRTGASITEIARRVIGKYLRRRKAK